MRADTIIFIAESPVPSLVIVVIISQMEGAREEEGHFKLGWKSVQNPRGEIQATELCPFHFFWIKGENESKCWKDRKLEDWYDSYL